MILAIPWQCVDHVWKDVSPLIQKAVDRSQQDFSINDIREGLISRDMQLWVWEENKQITTCCVTQIVTYPRRKVCQIPYLGGKTIKNWIQHEDEISKWAKSHGCTHLEGFCRDGWLKVLTPRHWKKVWTTIRKEI